MNLRKIGTLYECDEATLWINPASQPLIQDVVTLQLDRVQPYDTEAESNQNHRINNARTAFIIAEAFVLDSEWKQDHALKVYFEMRGDLTIPERWQLFLATVSGIESNLLYEAYNHTRPKTALDTETDGQKKETVSSPSPEPTPATNGKAKLKSTSKQAQP
jgi:hypothetical protein